MEPVNIPTRNLAALQASLGQTLNQRQSRQGVSLFVYGLLAKQPPFKFTSSKNATLNGYQRRFNLQDPINRGTPSNPGLTLGLAEGRSCQGVVYHIPEDAVIEGLTKVWEQEMLLQFYIPTWLEIEGTETLVMQTDLQTPALHDTLAITDIASIIANASGKSGTNYEYLADVISAFANHGVIAPYLTEIRNTLTTQQAA